MERKINKEIREYREAMFWGLTLRQFFFSVLGLGISVGIYFLLRGRLGMEAVSWACIFGMLPCAMLGFVTYNKMPAEKFLWAVIKTELLTPKQLMFKSKNLCYALFVCAEQAGHKATGEAEKSQTISSRRKKRIKKAKEIRNEHTKTKKGTHKDSKKRAGRDSHQHRL